MQPAIAQSPQYDPDLAGFGHGSSWEGSVVLISPQVVLACKHSTPPLGERIVFANGEVANIVGVVNSSEYTWQQNDHRLYVLDRAMPSSMVIPLWTSAPTFMDSNGNLLAGTRIKRAGFHPTSDWANGYSAAGCGSHAILLMLRRIFTWPMLR
jgi:hypothetical protein